MAMIECAECGKSVSSRAASCPGCGAPIAADGESIGSGVAHLTTTQATSKRLKLQTLISTVMILVGFVMVYAAYDLGHDTFPTGSILMAAGFVWFVVTRIRIWWHHS